MNAGCYNQEIKDKLLSVIFDINDKKYMKKILMNYNLNTEKVSKKKYNNIIWQI